VIYKLRAVLIAVNQVGLVKANEEFFKSNIIKESVTKSSFKAKSNRIFNYPFEALEEVISNAFYHRSYELDNPIEINIWPDKIEVLSFPGPLPPVTQEMHTQRRIVARNYRNRRIGDFFKELELTKGRASGFPTIYDSMAVNGSPKPIFETDENFGYFLAVLPVHPDSNTNKGVNEGVNEGVKIIQLPNESKGVNRELNQLYQAIRENPGIKATEMVKFSSKGLSTIERYLKKLKDNELIVFKGAPKTGGYYIIE
jgi:predicted HTH transcriptional regulator